jgi:antirestriction protein ArdC
MTQQDIRKSITDKIIDSLSKGRIPWRKPWSGIESPSIPTNFATERRYSGINILILWAESQERGYDVDFYATFNQWKAKGATIKKGEKAINVVLYKKYEKTVQDEKGEDSQEQFSILKSFPVFSIHQVGGAGVEKLLNQPAKQELQHDQKESFEHFVKSIGADIRFGGSRAFYRPSKDFIQMPPEQTFESFPAYADTLAHELAHWSESRLQWEGNYAEGEIRAEISAAFTIAALGIYCDTTSGNTKAYIQNWLSELQNDPKFIFKAASAASKATDFLLDLKKEECISN